MAQARICHVSPDVINLSHGSLHFLKLIVFTERSKLLLFKELRIAENTKKDAFRRATNDSLPEGIKSDEIARGSGGTPIVYGTYA